jgi:Right handed beta helix region
LPEVGTKLLIVAADSIPTNVTIRNNHFHDHRGRGILVGSLDSLVEHNVIERCTGAAILIPADVDPDYEGPGARNVVIRNNEISDVNRHPNLPDYPSAISAGVKADISSKTKNGAPIRNIVVERNKFSNVYSNSGKPIFFGAGVVDSHRDDN